ncbi:hypothetical protein J4Q44_G00316490 [Coregonus suidteri]|uniref:Uncharacterized protein n=1 Tax=Coregonus suidteri TaxID=861788 RepID=A0AAN8QBG7_9TELE
MTRERNVLPFWNPCQAHTGLLSQHLQLFPWIDFDTVCSLGDNIILPPSSTPFWNRPGLSEAWDGQMWLYCGGVTHSSSREVPIRQTSTGPSGRPLLADTHVTATDRLLISASDYRRARGERRNECEDPDAGDCALGVSAVFCQCWSHHGLHRAWHSTRRGGRREKAGPAEPGQGWPEPQTGRLEEETPTTSSLPQGAHAILEQGTASSAHPQVLISMLFLCLGGPCNEGPTLAQPEE